MGDFLSVNVIRRPQTLFTRTSFDSHEDKADEAKEQAEMIKKLSETSVKLAERARDITMLAMCALGVTAVFEFFDVMYTQREVNRKMRQVDEEEEEWREKLGAAIEEGMPPSSSAGLRAESLEEEFPTPQEAQPLEPLIQAAPGG